MICAIHQPNFFPYFGYFLKIARSNVFVFLDDTQMPHPDKPHYLNRVGINFNNIEYWLQATLKHDNYIKIKDAEFANNKWKDDLINKLQSAYCKSKFYNENKEFIFNMMLSPENNLSKYNINSIIQFCLYLNINRQFGRSSDKNIIARKSERLALLTKAFDCDTYLCGIGGENYKDNSEFDKYGVKLLVNKYTPPEYEPNKSLGLGNGLSIIDLLFRLGKKELEKLIKSKE